MNLLFTKIFRFIVRTLGVFLGLILLYGLAILMLGVVPINNSFAQAQQGVEIMVIDNGIHTDLVVPVKYKNFDWSGYLPVSDFQGANQNFTHLAFGWGNRKFYMETPEWKDLNLEVAFAAAFGIGRSAMHVYYLPAMPKPGTKAIPIKLTEAEYEKLSTYILNSFKQQNGRFLLIKGRGYTSTDNFYEANGRFSLLKTCNEWVNRGLKAAGIKTVFWAPVPFFMMHKLKNQETNKLIAPSHLR